VCWLNGIVLLIADTFSVVQVGGLMKNLPSVAALTAERDGEIRKAALNTLATAYKNLGTHSLFLVALTVYLQPSFGAYPIKPFS
jgi:hypothetical protein